MTHIIDMENNKKIGNHIDSNALYRGEITTDSNTEVLNSPDIIEYTGSSDEVTITISSSTIAKPADSNGFGFVIKNKTNNFVIFTIETEGAQEIDGLDNLVLSFAPYGTIKLYTDGSNVYSIMQ